MYLSPIVNDDLGLLFLVSTLRSSHIPFQLKIWEWFQRHCPWVLQGLSVIYGMIVRIRRTAYQQAWLPRRRLPKPVVSVGNITVGGTGKTPFVIWLAQQLSAKGKRVAILSRGYGRQDPSKNFMVSDGQSQIKEWRISGDEPTMIAQRCPWAIVAVGPDRFHLGQWVLEQIPCDCFILDDGYQHVSLFRDLDVVLFDGTDSQGLSNVLPAGRLREPLEATKGAGAFIFTRADSHSSIEPIQQRIEESLGKTISPIILKSVPKQVQHLVTDQVQQLELLLAFPLLLVSGIGNPGSFRNMLADYGSEILEEILFSDHCAYGQNEVNVIHQKMNQYENAIVMTTEKDAVKLREWFTKEDPIWFLSTELEFLRGEQKILELLDHAGFL